MQTKFRALYRLIVIVIPLLILGAMLSVVGCATNYPKSYIANFQGPDGMERVTMPGFRIRHNLFNGKYQRADEDNWGPDWPG
jgi:hypothetical protein